MSKIRKILTTGVVTLGMLSGPGVAAMTTGAANAAADISQLQVNVDDGTFKVLKWSSDVGMLNMTYTIPTGMTLKRVVAARPGEDKYRLMSELDTLAMGMLDGEVEGLIIVEMKDLAAWTSGQEYYGWVGFSIYDSMETGLRMLERNPADVIYVGVVLEDATGVESRYYYKVDYRSCAHQERIIAGTVIMCNAEKSGGKFRLVPESGESMITPPTWEEELATMMQVATEGYFDKLTAAEEVQAEGGEIGRAEIEQLEAEQVKLNAELAKYPAVIGSETLETDYATRLAALRKKVLGEENGQGNQGSSVVKPGGAGGSSLAVSGSAGVAAGVAGNAGTTGNAGVSSVVKVPAVTGVAKPVAGDSLQEGSGEAENSATAGEAKGEEADVKGGEDGEATGVEVPKLGGSWLERCWLALLIAGASATGVAGWFLIGVIAKKRKRDNR